MKETQLHSPDEVKIISQKEIDAAPIYKNLMPQNAINKNQLIEKLGYLSFTYGFIIRLR